jgi:hypothetical protein
VLHDDEFLTEFELCRWPLEQWHHRDHVKLAYLYLLHYSLEEAAAKLRAGIQAHNATHQVPNGPTSGYHETMTQAWLQLVHATMCEYGPAQSADEFVHQHPQLTQKTILRLFYSRERILSAEAKVSFVEPDLAPLPRSRRSFISPLSPAQSSRRPAA